MFKSTVQTVLQKVRTTTEGNWRIATCTFLVPLDYELAKEVSPQVADRLYRLSGLPTHEFRPCLEIGFLKFSDLKFPRFNMEFQTHPDVRAPGSVLPGTAIEKVHAVRHEKEMALVVQLRIRFPSQQSALMAKLIIELLHQTVWLAFSNPQPALPLDDQPIGEFVNQRNRSALVTS